MVGESENFIYILLLYLTMCYYEQVTFFEPNSLFDNNGVTEIIPAS